jgi:hypothetical protein
MVEVKCMKCNTSYLIPKDLQVRILTLEETKENTIKIEEEIKKYHNCNYSEEA